MNNSNTTTKFDALYIIPNSPKNKVEKNVRYLILTKLYLDILIVINKI